MKPDLLYYHCAIHVNGERVSSWTGWAQSSDDAEMKAANSYEDSHPGVSAVAYVEGHE